MIVLSSRRIEMILIVGVLFTLLAVEMEASKIAHAPLTVANQTAANLSLIDFFHLSNNSLRTGFETFYFISNQFIDNAFVPNLPQFFKEESTNTETNDTSVIKSPISEVFVNLGSMSFNKMTDVVSFSFKIYPSIFTFILCLLLLSVLVTFVGFVVCCYRSCCRGKFNRFDAKFDSIKRKIVSAILLLFLIVYLPSIIILFFTNQNSMSAVNKFPSVANDSLTKIGLYLQNDTTKFFDKVSLQIDLLKNDIPNSFDGILESSMNRSFEKLTIQDLVSAYNVGLSAELQKNHKFYANLIGLFDQLKSSFGGANTPNLQLKDLDSKLESIQKQINQTFNELSAITKNKSFSFGSFLVEASEGLKTAKTKYVDMITSFLNKSNDNLKVLSQDAEEIGVGLQRKFKDEPETFQQLEYYKYVYYVGLGLSILCTFLFVLFIIGLAGICANRTQNNFKQSCHRGIYANFLLSGSGIYFIFAIVIAVCCVAFSSVGILTRHFVCNTAIDLNHSPVYKVVQKIPIVSEFTGDMDIHQLLAECKVLDRSSEFKRQVKKNLLKFAENKKPEIVSQIETELSKMGQTTIKDSLESLRSKLAPLNQTLSDFTTQNDQKIDEIFKILNQTISSMDQETASNFKLPVLQKQAKELTNSTKVKLEEFMLLLKNKLDLIGSGSEEGGEAMKQMTSFKALLTGSIIESFDSRINQNIDKVFESSPSCRSISNVYISVVQTSCYEFLDNFNTFWVTLLVVFLLNIVITAFSIVLADMFRKYYAYEGILATEVSNYEKDANDHLKGASNEVLDDIARLRFYNKPTIENFEMNRYYRPEYRPDYYDRRA